MSNYVGKKCVICDGEFKHDDDIVVCPECGTPYHRECWKAAGKCVADGLHKTKMSWQSFQAECGKITLCKHCGAENPAKNVICESCGKMVSGLESSKQSSADRTAGYPFYVDDFCGLSPDEDFDGVKLSDIAEFVGVNKRYYIPIFKRMKDTGKRASFNFFGLIFPHYYFASRKMYFSAFIAVLFYVMVELQNILYFVPDDAHISSGFLARYPELYKALAALAASEKGTIIIASVNYINLVGMIVFAVFSNWFYYRHCIRTIKSIRTSCGGDAKYTETVKRRGGTSFFGVFITFLVLLPFIALNIADSFAA